jgi:hypothetical protein
MLATRHAVGTVGGVTEWARIAMLTSAGRVQQCRAPSALTRSSGTYASSTVRRPSRKKHVAGTSVIGATLTSGNCSQLVYEGRRASHVLGG